MAQTSLELMIPCLSHTTAGITGLYHHALIPTVLPIHNPAVKSRPIGHRTNEIIIMAFLPSMEQVRKDP